jgi:hypothetical protein
LPTNSSPEVAMYTCLSSISSDTNCHGPRISPLAHRAALRQFTPLMPKSAFPHELILPNHPSETHSHTLKTRDFGKGSSFTINNLFTRQDIQDSLSLAHKLSSLKLSSKLS